MPINLNQLAYITGATKNCSCTFQMTLNSGTIPFVELLLLQFIVLAFGHFSPYKFDSMFSLEKPVCFHQNILNLMTKPISYSTKTKIRDLSLLQPYPAIFWRMFPDTVEQ